MNRHHFYKDRQQLPIHYSDVIMSAMASQITGVSTVCSAVCSYTDQRKYLSSAPLAFVRGIHRWPVNFPHKRASDLESVSIWWRHHVPKNYFFPARWDRYLVEPLRRPSISPNWLCCSQGLTALWILIKDTDMKTLYAITGWWGRLEMISFPTGKNTHKIVWFDVALWYYVFLYFSPGNHDDVTRWKHFSRYWPLWGESTADRWISLTMVSDPEFWCFSSPEQTVEQTIETPVIWDDISPIMTSL